MKLTMRFATTLQRKDIVLLNKKLETVFVKKQFHGSKTRLFRSAAVACSSLESVLRSDFTNLILKKIDRTKSKTSNFIDLLQTAFKPFVFIIYFLLKPKYFQNISLLKGSFSKSLTRA